MVNLNWPEQEKSKLAVEVSLDRSRKVTRGPNQLPKAIVSVGVVLCSSCKCECELEIALDKQIPLATSVFDKIRISYKQTRIPILSRSTVRQKSYTRPAQQIKKVANLPKKEVLVKLPGNNKPLATIIDGRRIQKQYCTFLKNREDTKVFLDINSARIENDLEKSIQTKQLTHQQDRLIGSSFYQGSSSREQSRVFPADDREDWTEGYGEEQVDYEPAADDRTGFLETEE
ncbi:unnamed protein product [Prunus armeniaca]